VVMVEAEAEVEEVVVVVCVCECVRVCVCVCVFDDPLTPSQQSSEDQSYRRFCLGHAKPEYPLARTAFLGHPL
jgi:hypothetical protein